MISDTNQKQQLLRLFSFLASASEEFQRMFFNSAIPTQIPVGHTIAEPGTECSQLALVLNGSVRVYKLGANGREITLYRIKEGDSCVLTASCLISSTPFPAIAETEIVTNAVIIPANMAKTWMSQYQPWSSFVFGLISQRLAEVITVLDNVAFQRMDARVADYLLAHANPEHCLSTTHNQIAGDLGSSREVVSRTLKEFSKQSWIDMSRGTLILKDPASLRKLAEDS